MSTSRIDRRHLLQGGLAAVAGATVGIPAVASDHPDAELLRLCAEAERAWKAYDYLCDHHGDLVIGTDESAASWKQVEAAIEVVGEAMVAAFDTPPRTIAGVLAKYRVLLLIWTDVSDPTSIDCNLESELTEHDVVPLTAIARDLERLAAG